MRAMQVVLLMISALVLLAAMVGFTTTYTVRFTEEAVKTRFGRAVDAGVRDEPGLGFKWPYPIESVVKYDTRLRFLQERSQTQQTADDRQIVVEAFCTWRVVDALTFFERFSNAGDRAVEHYAAAERIIRNNLRSAMAETSRYRMDELFTSEAGGSKLPDLEQSILSRVRSSDEAGQALADAYGVEITGVGINRVVLPEETTTRVFERMTAYRDRLAKEIEAQGEAQASAIVNTAQAEAQRIKAFAERRAQEIRAKGETEAAVYLSQMNDEPELAVFLDRIDLMKNGLGKRTTLVLPTSMFGMEMFNLDALDDYDPDEQPLPEFGQDWFDTDSAGNSAGGDR